MTSKERHSGHCRAGGKRMSARGSLLPPSLPLVSHYRLLRQQRKRTVADVPVCIRDCRPRSTSDACGTQNLPAVCRDVCRRGRKFVTTSTSGRSSRILRVSNALSGRRPVSDKDLGRRRHCRMENSPRSKRGGANVQ